MCKRMKILFTVTAIILFGCLVETCYAGEGFLLIKDDTLVYKDKGCKSVTSERPIYKFTYGDVEKKEAGKIYVRFIGNLLLTDAQYITLSPTQKFGLLHSRGWINESDVILFQYNQTSDFSKSETDLYDKVRRLFLKKYFP